MASSSNGQSSVGEFSYDVFLSFRGADTRKGFTSHLYAALDRSGIKTFMDDQELKTGEDISPKLLHAIQGSRASIIVFSQNYAFSTWCLQELVEILECKRTKGHIVIPLYYDVDTPVIRRQTGKFADAFAEHSTRVSEQKVHQWRSALQEVADLKGHALANEDNGIESRFIQKIVDEVQVEVIMRSSNVTDSLIEASVDSNRDCVNTLLSIGSNDVRLIGIYGMGGIGKSTVSKALYNEHKNKFDCSAVVENVKEANGLLHLQEMLLRQLEKKDVKLNTTDEGTERIKRICESKKVLILLDDFDNFNQINKLKMHKFWLSTAGSRVILVTRDVQLLKEAHVQLENTHEMKVMNEDDSLKLFRKHAFEEEENPSKDQESLSSAIAKSCAGLPLSLEVIGRHLRGRDLTFWKNAWEELQSKPHVDVRNSLQISYDALDKDRKNVFLDAACFFIGRKMECLIQFWGGCGFPKNSVTDLIGKCLFKIDEHNCLWMHDHLRDMGRAIVREASSLEKQSRVWIPEEVDDILRSQEKTAVEGIRLDVSKLRSRRVEAKAFENMPKLRFLEIIGTVEVVGNISGGFEKLLWLIWEDCLLENLPLAFHPTKLIRLDMRRSKIINLWEGVKHLPNLKILNLSDSKWLEETPDFSGTPSLERLILHHCTRLKRIHPSICLLTSLVQLNLQSCEKLTSLPTRICSLTSLEELNLSFCVNLGELPEQLGKMKCLQTLKLQFCDKIRHVPKSICNLTALQIFNLSFCYELECLPEELGNLVSLKELNVHSCSMLKELPLGLGNLKSLMIFDASKTPLEELPDSVGHLTSLVQLHLYDCKNMKFLPDSICDLSSLQALNIDNCSRLQQLPNRLGDMVSLRELHALNVGCKQLPNSINNMKKLNMLLFSQSDPQLNDLPNNFFIPSNSSLKRLRLKN